MPLSSLVYIILLSLSALGGALYNPLISVLAYIATYNVNPTSHWWGSGIEFFGGRFSFVLATATAIGFLLQRRKLRYERILESQESLLLLFIGTIWLSIPLGLGQNPELSNVVKMTKVMLIALLATHIVTDIRRYELLLWTLILSGVFQAYEVYQAPAWLFHGGRFNIGIGGTDLSESNFLAAHLAIMLVFVGMLFYKGSWKVKLTCLPCAAIILNGFVLCRSRGGFLAIIMGALSAFILAWPGSRKKILGYLCLAVLSLVLLADPGFWHRSQTISTDISQLDISAQRRLEVWKASIQMVFDHPLGIGEGNFRRMVGRYNPNVEGKDTHNTILRCTTELGFQGVTVLLLLMINAFRITFWIRKRAGDLLNDQDFYMHIWALQVALVMYIVAGLFVTHTYIEEFYWLLLFPVMLKRAFENRLAETGDQVPQNAESVA